MNNAVKSTIIEILSQSKESGTVEDLECVDLDLCIELNLLTDAEGKIVVDREKRIDLKSRKYLHR